MVDQPPRMYSPVQVLSSGDIVVLEKPDNYVIGRLEPGDGRENSEPLCLDTSVHPGDRDRMAALRAARELAAVEERSVFLITREGALLQLHDDVSLDLPIKPK